jgi:hypothetical protein
LIQAGITSSAGRVVEEKRMTVGAIQVNIRASLDPKREIFDVYGESVV